MLKIRKPSNPHSPSSARLPRRILHVAAGVAVCLGHGWASPSQAYAQDEEPGEAEAAATGSESAEASEASEEASDAGAGEAGCFL